MPGNSPIDNRIAADVFGRLLVCTAALALSVQANVASAQTVIVRKVPRDAKAELVLNTTTVATAAPDSIGNATLTFNLTRAISKSETDASLYADLCTDLQRIVIVERGVTPPSPGSCERRPITGLFSLRGATTIVIDVSGPGPTMRLRQGRAPEEWLTDPQAGARPTGRTAPTGLVVSGGGARSSLADAVAISCGNVTDCQGNGAGLTYAFSAGYWFAPFLGVDVGYTRPSSVKTNGSGNRFRFNSELTAQVVTVSAKAGVPIGPARVYGLIGPTYHRGTLDTSETIDAVTASDGTTTVPGGTQTFELETDGWSWAFGGGLEVWATDSFALFGEVVRVALKGDARDGGEGTLDDHITAIGFGVRVHIGR